MVGAVTLLPLTGIPLIEPGDDLAVIIEDALRTAKLALRTGDVLVVAQKVVSKATGRFIALASVTPSAEAEALASLTGKDPRHVEVVLRESGAVVKVGPKVLVTEHRTGGWVMANAGIDESNISHGRDGEDPQVLLLPEDCDAAAADLRKRLGEVFGVWPGVIINDSFGRPWRNGVVGVALGAAGVPALIDRIGALDLFGRKMKVTEIAWADELASAASLLMGQADEGLPVVLVRGLSFCDPERPAAALVRPRDRDMFR